MLQAQLRTRLVDFEPDAPALEPLQEKIDFQTQVVMSALSDLEKRDGEGDFWAERKDLYKQRFDAELEIANLDIQAGAHKRRYSELERNLPEIFVQSREYETLKHKAEEMRGQLDGMLDKEFQISMSIQRDGATVERRAGVQVVPTYGRIPRPLWMSILAGAAVGFIIGLALALMREAMDTSIQSIEDANRYIGLEVIGTIPEMKFGKGKRRRNKGGTYVVSTDEEQIDACIVTQHDPKSPVSEAYRSFRTNFQFATIKKRPKTVMITSAVPGEGKTTTAVNFAVTMADRGMRVLIVDTDLRRPNVHRVLKMERGPGLADVLRERIPVKNVIRPTRVENLWIISSGRVPPNPSELIGSERMKKLMEELGQTFDFVVCDAPSILVVTDPVLLATHVDSVALVVSVKYAKRETIQRAKKLLETGNPAVAGVVLNALEATRRHYYYYYYYYDDRATA
jgi:capsular exopolysaccharide synthesis family protein